MLIDTRKLIDIKHITVDITDNTPYLYFLFHIDETTPRYSFDTHTYVPDPNGPFVVDEGMDVFQQKKRLLKYIGQTNGRSIHRLIEHYHSSYYDNKKLNQSTNGDTHGIGPVFTHARIMKIPRFIYDVVRIHHETILVRKFLPEINKNSSSVFGDIQKMILLNSKGKVSLQELVYPYLLHARDIWKAAEAYKREDWEWVKANCVVSNQYRHLTIEELKSGKYSFGENFWMGKTRGTFLDQQPGKKKQFSRWFRSAIVFKHNKQYHARKQFARTLSKYRKLYGDYHINQLNLFHEETELHSETYE